MLNVLTGSAFAENPTRAVEELHAAVVHPALSAAFLFTSAGYDLSELGEAIAARFTCPVIGAVVPGSILSGRGYTMSGIVGAGIVSDRLRACPILVPSISTFNASTAVTLARRALAECGELAPDESRFAMLLIDAQSCAEEIVTASLHHAFGGIHLFGGSVGTDFLDNQGFVYHDGRFHEDAALLTLFRTSLPYAIFQTQHYRATGRTLVVTDADPATRTVRCFNGRPAGDVYAEALDVPVESLGADDFSKHPLLLHIGNRDFVRAAIGLNLDRSLQFSCAVEVGTELAVGRAEDLLERLRAELAELEGEMPSGKLLVLCDCLHRRSEIAQDGLFAEVAKVLATYTHIGLSTYGEQLDGLHLNQTLTGLLLGGGAVGGAAASID